jgi:LmbE family N-acetylglucosaminyl deacetylase
MLRLDLSPGGRAPARILCLGAHCDDIEIGCGGALLRLLQGGRTQVTWVTFCSDETRAAETRAAAARFLEGAGDKHLVIHAFRDGFLPRYWTEAKEAIERIKRDISPDLIFTHCGRDLHQDHRTVSELTWNTFRDHLILEYEIPKYDGDLGSPNFFVNLDEGLCKKKAAEILASYPSQAAKTWFTEDTFLSLMRIRGVEANSPTRYAEAFYCRKLTV